ncbi:MAG: 23S rRNA (adenine(2030)-N(6))-methyltransferase RlmJ, partial [Treponema sp.]|nr:23S rRNA (adenine(2030)-N(6))-methyltransferase RlmJ [Treponema sp.]
MVYGKEPRCGIFCFLVLLFMLSYRHAFHAGNAADVFKHAVLVFCADYMLSGEKPCAFIDTHAGAGLYALNEGYAAKNREWENGAGKLFAAGTETLPPLLAHYAKIVSAAGAFRADKAAAGGFPSFYPGSPLIVRTLMRPADRAVCFELHPSDFAALGKNTGTDRRFTLRNEDGLAGLRGLLPPPCRRGLILIDPSYEIKSDFALVPETVKKALRRFSSGIFIVWYPLLETYGAETAEELFRLGGKRCRIELYTGHGNARVPGEGRKSPRGMYG